MPKEVRQKVPTQADVARLAGVSRPMVSYVLNNSTSVSVAPETRKRILDAIAKLAYKPDSMAQSLRTGKTRTIAGFIPDITNPFYPAFQRGIQDVARRYQFGVITYNTDGLEEEERQCLEWMQQGRVDGVIGTFWHLTADDLGGVLGRNVAVVKMCVGPSDVQDIPIDYIYVDNAAAAKCAVTYLIDKGHTRIGMIGGQTAPPRQMRVLGYQQALAEHHLSLDESLLQGGDFAEGGGYTAMQSLLKTRPLPTAVFAANDLMAIGALLAIREAGLSVPDDIAIVGFDDIPAAKMVHPALTTITQFAHNMGVRAAEMLFERLAEPGRFGMRVAECPFELIVRDSA